jgi:hypothetical protein
VIAVKTNPALDAGSRPATEARAGSEPRAYPTALLFRHPRGGQVSPLLPDHPAALMSYSGYSGTMDSPVLWCANPFLTFCFHADFRRVRGQSVAAGPCY